jgi:glyoxylase-like metal-dependent hydrolase (beta-lactamase superfamily II)
MEILPKVHHVPDIVANPYLIVEPDGLTLIDTGLPNAAKKVMAYIKSLGASPHDLKRIILTHSDLDHVGCLAALQKSTGARTYASQIEADAIASGRPSRQIKTRSIPMRILFKIFGLFYKVTPIQVDEILKDGQTLPVLGGLRVVETGGHTPGHISLYSPSAGVLFCGDSMVSENGLQPSRPALTWDAAAAAESVRKQAALGARVVCCGHGPVVMDAHGKFPQV